MSTPPAVDATRLRDALERLVAVPSVAFPGFPEAPVREAADVTVAVLEEAGVTGIERVDVPGAPPAIYAHLRAADPDAPTVLLYAHYDVQPGGPEESWTTPAFEPTERDGRLYGRGTADDKCGVALHAAALAAFRGEDGALAPPVHVKVLIEGEEETGNGTLSKLVAADPDRFRADAFVIADGSNVATGTPTLTTSLRGMAVVDVTIDTLEAPVHSGVAGGPGPDALLALSRLIASLHHDDGSVAVEGLDVLPWDGAAIDPEEWRAEVGVLEGVDLLGTGPIADQLFVRPSVTAIGIDAPTVDTAANALIPRAKARLSVRLAPTQDPAAAAQAVIAHVFAHVPWGAQVTVAEGPGAPGAILAGEGRVAEAAARALESGYGAPAVRIGSGGAIPLCADLSTIYPDAAFVLWGPGDERSRIHAGDESVDLADLERAAVAEVAFLVDVGAAGR
ncbi:M20/M25/M40 family metallo-hydrolase [Patulibacter sp.]|uniref:M20/M25/M40 family metallo-hydrolase n=1 Tax=Patulibacter sp. TaxID=1912859 RepID=UPI002723E3D1|nr:M20/M25/M40 family metallo-hydrolase [Patulibacter sp.]MDO9406895.1 M20/M25/M40 family metallo-hydrolase [Patulibacter sp.]